MNNLDKLLQKRGSASELARRTGITPNQIADYRSYARRPSKENARRLAQGLGLPVLDVFPGYHDLAGREVRS